MKEAKLILDGEEYIFGEKYFMLNEKGEWLEKTLVAYDFHVDLPFCNERTWHSQISKTDPTDKRNLLKGYGVVCVNQEQADIMQEFVGDLFSKNPAEQWNEENYRTLKYAVKNFLFGWECKTCHSQLGNLTFEGACEMCGIEIPKPKMRYMIPLEVIQQHTDKMVYRVNRSGIVHTQFTTQMIAEEHKVCRDKTKPIDEWVWEDLRVEDK